MGMTRLYRGIKGISTRRGCRKRSRISFGSVMFVNKTNMKTLFLQGCSNPFLFLTGCGLACITMDFVEWLPSSQGHSVIFVVVDRLSKCSHFTSLSRPYTAAKVAQLFIQNIFKLYGIPQSIILGRDPTFTSLFWRELFRLQGTSLKLSTSYNPKTDGQT
jgi:hypothetical protein